MQMLEGHRARKRFGQNFLHDEYWISRIARAVDAQPGEFIVEIGPGQAALTRELVGGAGHVNAVEIDRDLAAWLKTQFAESELTLIEADALMLDWTAVAGEKRMRVVGNLPYNISSQIFFKVLENRDLVPECVGMIQKEVAVRIAEPPGSKEYGILSVLLQAWYDIEYLFTVNETVFNPPPKVKSAVIRLRRNRVGRLGCDEALFVKVVKASFGQRRKMIRNSLRAVFGDFGGAEHPFFTQRAEQLSVADFVQLTDWVAANRK